MNRIYIHSLLLLLLLFIFTPLHAQVNMENSGLNIITNGGKIKLDGNWLNNGVLMGNTGSIIMAGSTDVAILNTNGYFNNLSIDHPDNELFLQSDITINNDIVISNGDIVLSGYTINLSPTATLSESNGQTVKGNTGQIQTTRTITAPTGLNIGGMGITLSTNADLGPTTITRGHSIQVSAGTNSIARYFDIAPTNNTNLDATLTFLYDESELNGQAAADLQLYHSEDQGASWTLAGGVVDVLTNGITINGIDAFSRWTASAYCLENVAAQANCKSTISVSLDIGGNYTLTATELENGSIGACGIQSFVLDWYSFDCIDVGMDIPVKMTITDGRNNTSTCTTMVQVQDVSPPQLDCIDVTVQLDANGTATFDAIDAADPTTIYDNCTTLDDITFQLVEPINEEILGTSLSLDCTNVGSHTYRLMGMDESSNFELCLFTLTVEDPLVSNIACKNASINLDINGIATLAVSQIDNGSLDACGIASMTLSKTDFTCSDIGSNSITLTLTDANNNVASCTANVEIQDNTPPTAICKTTDITLPHQANYNLQQSDVLDNTASFDNCGIASTSFPSMTFSCDDVGSSFNVLVSLSDFSGNTNTCNATINISADNSLPNDWGTTDIGITSIGNDYIYEPCEEMGTFYITGSGNNVISSTTDNIAFAYQSLCGNGSITAKIESITPNGYGGLMIRETSNPGSKQVSIFSNLTNILRHEARYTINGIKQVNSFYKPLPYWLRLDRQGDWIFAYSSIDGTNFQYVHGAFVPMQECVEIGLASFTYLPYAQTEAVFSNVSVGGNTGAMGTVGHPQVDMGSNQNLPATDLSHRINLFPNPASTEFNMMLDKPLEVDATVEIISLYGQIIATQTLQAGTLNQEWQTANWPAGTYTLRLQQAARVLVMKQFVVVK